MGDFNIFTALSLNGSLRPCGKPPPLRKAMIGRDVTAL